MAVQKRSKAQGRRNGVSMEIEVTGIKKAYARKQVLTDITFSMEAGSCAVILGSNGSGKSTLLSILAGVRRADGGSFLYRGTDLLRRPALIPKVLGYVPQGDPLMEELNAWDNLRMWYDRETLKRELADGALKLLGIDGFLKTPVRKMWGALDPVCKENIRRFLDIYRKDGGIVLMASHDAQDLELCNMYYILRGGALHSYPYDGDFHRLAEAL